MLTIIPSMDVPPPDPNAPEGLLGPYLPPPPGLVLLSGEASAGKTVFLRNATYHIAEGTEFVGLTPSASLRVLYLDLESTEQLHWKLVRAIGKSDNLGFVLEMPRPLSASAGQADLKKAIDEWKAVIVVVDPLPVAWPVHDENDNAEADRQMSSLKKFARDTATLVVVLWNMGEGYVKAKFKARGATARLDRADVALNYTEVSAETRKLEIVKSRFGNLRESITVQFEGDHGFRAVKDVVIAPSQTQLIEAHIVRLVTERPYSRPEILAALRKMEFTDDNLVDKALGALRSTGRVTSPERGVYALPESSDPQ